MIEPATLNVRVTAQGMTARYEYDLRVGSTVGESPPLEMEYTVEVDPGLVKGCRDRIDAALTKAADAQSVPEPGLVKELARWGKLLYDQLFPRVQGNAAELVTRLHASTGPVLVRTNEQEVPWELLHDGRDFLGLRHDLGRRLVGKRPVVGGRSISRVGRALIVGDTIGDLPSAREEVAKVAAWLGGRGIECKVLLGHEATVLDVVTELASDETPYDLFHFCGHVATGDGTTGLMMHGRQLLGAVALQTLSSCGAPPVAFINGCASAGGGEVASMCMSFMSLGAKTVVGTRTEVADEGAWQFAAEFYGRLLAGEPAGAGVRAARAALRERPDAAWASFILYGDPAVGITKDETTESPQLPEPHDEDPMIALAPDARQLMQRVYESAADRGGVASVDLLQGLLGEEDIRQRIEGSIGADAMEALDQVIDQVLRPPSRADGDSAADGDSGTDDDGSSTGTGLGGVLSDTVNRVFTEAATRVAADGRSTITTADITAAFVAVGGGVSARLLELCGVPLARLLPDESTLDPSSLDPSSLDPITPGQDTLEDDSPALPRDPAPLNGDERLPMDDLSRSAVGIVRLANLLADGRGEVISTYTLLLAFGAMGSEVLRRGMHEQGATGERAFRQLSGMLTPRRRDLSPRVHDVLDQARRRSAAGRTSSGRVGEAAILLALLEDEESSARELMRKLGIDPEQLIQALGRAH
ncbi:CHAT domain-containing protein [Streptomyces sp. NBC_00620]|uniref:CHAT domain-containing protein n=1 Tax=Streptomyces sp. NBC_00620 TaxID=2903666 RepID=UPI0022532380|nr:CHAT domain-containing protein [Streptomyces sp. NBC_00620]MCX4979553.1 CHAT domain-containing protein [Streptomyces sp. NBC_00620]